MGWCHDVIYRCLCDNPNLSWNTINRTHSYMYFKALFLNKRAAASAIKGCAFAGVAIVHAVNKIEKKYKILQILCASRLLVLYFSTKINFIIVYQNRMENHKKLVDVTPVQPAFQYRGMKCKLSCGMVLLLVTI